ncbi:MAG: DNA primase [Pseudomonadales bacterium]|nr:DNA primase [Pseudomonadales bacterium]
MAGLIPQHFIDELLSRADIVDVIDKRVKLRKTGKNYSALCPFHQEKSPSFSVEPDKQFYYCFGCGAGGNVLGFVMAYEQKDFPQAVETLAADYGLSVPRQESGEDTRRKQEHEELFAVMQRADHFYQQQLRQHAQRQQAVDYLKSRGLSGAIAKQYGIGFAPPGWDSLLTHLSAASITPELMIQCGLLIEKEDATADKRRYYDRFRDRIIFPIRDSRGRTIGFGGRVLGDDKPKYLNSPETPLYHKGQELYGLYEARKSRQKLTRFIIVEGYMDVVALAQHGIHYAVATLGTATNSTHLTRLFRQVSEVIYCFDGDEAGRKAAWRGLEATLPIMQDGRVVRFLFLPEGEDPDTLVRKIGKERFSEKIDHATSLEDFFFNHLCEQVDLHSMEGKARLVTLAQPLLQQLPDGVFRQLMYKRLAELSETEVAMGKAASRQNRVDAPQADPEQPAGKPLRPARSGSSIQRPASLKAIELLLSQPDVALEMDASLWQELQGIVPENDDSLVLLLELIELARNDPKITAYRLLGHCYGTPRGNQLNQLMKYEKITPAAGVKHEFSFLIESMLKTARNQLYRQQLIAQLKNRIK